MYTSISQFIDEWNQEAASTQKVLDALTDESLQQKVSADDRTLGAIAWHIVSSTPGMLIEFGITVDSVKDENTIPTSAKEIARHSVVLVLTRVRLLRNNGQIRP